MKNTPVSNKYLYLILILFAGSTIVLTTINSNSLSQNFSPQRFQYILGFFIAVLIYLDMKYLHDIHKIIFQAKILNRTLSENSIRSIYYVSVFLFPYVVIAYIFHRRSLITKK
jgi:hypothetical protein